LTSRLFRFRCSYLVETDQFKNLPETARDAIFERMWQILSGQERDRRYQTLTLEERGAIVDILRGTRTDLPAYFHQLTR
jgi:hypothetical protein